MKSTLPKLIPVAEAQARLADFFPPVRETETVPLERALGRVLAHPVHIR